MAKKSQIIYECQICNHTSTKWSGRCSSCGSWDSLLETRPIKSSAHNVSQKAATGSRLTLSDLGGDIKLTKRILSNMSELDRVFGGGIVPGSVALIGGDPGIGKSTLLLQAATKIGKELPIYYFSGEEALEQIQLRAKRLDLTGEHIKVASTGNVSDIIATCELERPNIIVIDSIQTMYIKDIDSAPGSISQLRSVTHVLIELAKRLNIATIIVGHVTKEGQIAGPRMLEHMVDTVLYFEGERNHQFRILRAVKNRFGATDEIGVFEVGEYGLTEVHNPSAIFLSDKSFEDSGIATFCGIEGSRPILAEIQTLIAPSSQGNSRRSTVGADPHRVNMILAILETKCAIKLSNFDIFVNVTGGLRLQEPAADLAIAAALISSAKGFIIPKKSIFFGELGLAGEVRTAQHTEKRLMESARLGFERAIIPSHSYNKAKKQSNSLLNIEQHKLNSIHDLYKKLMSMAKVTDDY